MRADDRSSAVISRGTEHLTDTSTPSDCTHAADSLPIRGSAAGNKKQMLKKTSPQIGDLVHSYNPFSGHPDPAIVLDITGHEDEYGPYYKLLVTPQGEDPRIDESPAEYVGPFNTSPRLQ